MELPPRIFFDSSVLVSRGLCAPELKFGLKGLSWLKPTENLFPIYFYHDVE